MKTIEEAATLLQINQIAQETRCKWQHFIQRLTDFSSVLVAYSGGVDSTFLAYVSSLVLGEKSLAVFVNIGAESEKQVKLAQRWADEGQFAYLCLNYDLLGKKQFASNPVNRCYYCKSMILDLLCGYAKEHGYSTVIEGQNQDDQGDYRPGRAAVQEAGVISPLAEAGFTKEEIRWLAHQMGLPVWNLPSSPCLASRFPYGFEITKENLLRVDQSEAFLHQLGFSNVRVRIYNDSAKIEVASDQIPKLISLNNKVSAYLLSIGFKEVEIDTQGYRQGSLNEGLKI